jgi:quinoprotein glucose dehydrogenase
MPSFPNIQSSDLNSLLYFLRSGTDIVPVPLTTATSRATEKKELASIGATKARYHFTGYTRFVDPDGYPANSTPWGTLSAIDMNTGKYLWKIPLGEYPELAAKGLRNTGTENYGGPIVTAGGILFIASTIFDRQFHAFDSATGKLLWHTELPYGGLATPSTYAIKGKQYVVIAAGGGKDPKHDTGGVIIAYALP